MTRLTRKTNGKDYCSYCRVVELLIEREQKPKDDFYDEPEQYYERWPYQEAICGDDEERLIKLGKLEDIEEELGCPLEVVFKALNNGIVDIENREHRYIHLRNGGVYVIPEGWVFHTFHFSYVFELKDYKKTWWLKGEKV